MTEMKAQTIDSRGVSCACTTATNNHVPEKEEVL